METKISNKALEVFREDFFKSAKAKPVSPHFYVSDAVHLRREMESEKTYNRIFSEEATRSESIKNKFLSLWKKIESENKLKS